MHLYVCTHIRYIHAHAHAIRYTHHPTADTRGTLEWKLACIYLRNKAATLRDIYTVKMLFDNSELNTSRLATRWLRIRPEQLRSK